MPLVLMACAGDKSKGEAFFEAGKYVEAVEYYTKQIERTGNDLSAYYNRGRAFEEMGEMDKAIADFEYILEKDERHLQARLSLSKVAYTQGDYARSSVEAAAALKFHKSSYQAHFSLGRARHQLGYFQAALEAYDAAIGLKPDYAEAYLYRGALKSSLNDPSACSDFRQAEQLGADGAQETRKKYCP